MTANQTPAWWRVIDWRTVLAAGLPAWLLILGVVLWFKLVPKRERLPIEPPMPGAVVVRVETAPMARLTFEVSPMPRAVRELAALPRPVAERAPAPRAAFDKPAGGPDPVRDLVTALLQNLAQPRPVAKAIEKPVPDGCKTHGTAIHFTKSTLEAMKQAKAKDKLVFVLHLSGNIEDDGFT